MGYEFIDDPADVRLHERYVPEDQSKHSDLLHISLCKALYELAAKDARIAELESSLDEMRICSEGDGRRIAELEGK